MTRPPTVPKLPDDVLLCILDYMSKRSNPLEVSEEKCYFTSDPSYMAEEQIHIWQKLRLVCRKWSQWYSIDAIRYFTGNLNVLAENKILSEMTNLYYLKVHDPDNESWETNAAELVAAVLPYSVRQLASCSAKLLQSLSQKRARALQSVAFGCSVLEPYIKKTVMSLFRKFDGRIAHFYLNYRFQRSDDRQSIAMWRNAISGARMDALTIKTSDFLHMNLLPILPANLKQFILATDGIVREFKSHLLSSSASTLESVCCTRTYFILKSSETPVFEKLTHLSAYDISFGEGLRQSLPNLEFVFVRSHPSQRLNHLPTMKCLEISYDYIGDINYDDNIEYNLSSLPPSLETFEFDCINSGSVYGLPPPMLHLTSLTLSLEKRVLPKGIFKEMPVLEKLLVETVLVDDDLLQENHFIGVEMREFLPLRNSLVEMEVVVNADEMDGPESRDVLFQFTRLKILKLYTTGKSPLVLDKLPSSLEQLCLKGSYSKGSQMELLPNLKIVRDETIDDERSDTEGSFNAMYRVLCCAPSVTSAILFADGTGDDDDLPFEDIGLPRLEKLSYLCMHVYLNSIQPESVINVLLNCPNVREFELYGNIDNKKDIGNVLPGRLLELVESGRLTTLKQTSIFLEGLTRKNLNNEGKAAFKELKKHIEITMA